MTADIEALAGNGRVMRAHPDDRPPKTVVESCEAGNLMRGPSPDVERIAPRCEQLIADGIVTEKGGLFVPGVPSEDRRLLAVERLRGFAVMAEEAQIRYRACPDCLRRIYPDPPEPEQLLAQGWRTYVGKDGRTVLSCPHGDL